MYNYFVIFSRIHRKIEHLRQQPEPVRLRAATLMTAVSGAALVIVWLAVLLPLQLALSRPATPENPGPLKSAWQQFRREREKQTQQAIAPPEQEVSGARVSLPSPSLSPSATFEPSFAPLEQQELPIAE